MSGGGFSPSGESDGGRLSCAGWRSDFVSATGACVQIVTDRSANMALSVGPDIGGSADRRRRVCAGLGFSFDRLTFARQVHGARVVRVTEALAGAGRDRSRPRIAEADGLVTDLADTPLMVCGADCALVAVVDPERRAIGVAHSGWRGTAAGMPGALVGAMAEAFGSLAGDLVAAVSPCARGCCYEVGRDVVKAFDGDAWGGVDLFGRRDGRTFFDLGRAVAAGLERAGVAPDRIDDAGTCTICSERFFSYRRDGAGTGQHALIVALKTS